MTATTISPSVEVAAAIFDEAFYAAQTQMQFGDSREAFDHYLEHAARLAANPSPYFDAEYYLSQVSSLESEELDPLLHYATNGPLETAHDPNPLFSNAFYLETHEDVRNRGENPFVHFLGSGRTEGRLVSAAHREMATTLRRSGQRGHLLRGRIRRGTVLFLLSGSGWGEVVLRSCELLGREHGLDSTVVFMQGPPGLAAMEQLPEKVLVLAEQTARGEPLRPSALRLLGLALASAEPLFVVTDHVDFLYGPRTAGVRSYFLVGDGAALDEQVLSTVAPHTARIVFESRELFRQATGSAGPHPPNVAVRSALFHSSEAFVDSVLEFAGRDRLIATVARKPARRSGKQTRRIVVPCADWSVSGVNAALDAVGRALAERGWDFELLFTREQSYVVESAAGQLPELPHRWLVRRRPGIEHMWEALIADLTDDAPCIVLTGYDFFGNSVVPALTNDVGVVMWAQADDGDYYEQAYRLGRYCNAVVCVSNRIREQVTAIHPGIGERTHVIHNTSVAEADIVPWEPRGSDRLRIVYTGRLIQYQKRVLDFVYLANELDSLGVDFTIDLIGTTPRAHDEAAALLPGRAARHLDRGRMSLLGRLSRAEVLDELRSSDMFVLVSDFEGLPLSLVEAMAAGCVPVVAEMESGIGELLVPGENGVIVPGRDYAHWARTIRDLWHGQERLAAMAEQAQQTVRDSFTVERIADQFEEVLGGVAEEIAAGYERPPALTWGARRAPFGDVLPPPMMYRVVPVAGLG